MNVNDLFPSKYLKAHDLGGKAFTLTIRAATLEDVGHGAEKERKLAIAFDKATKMMLLNRTNAMIIASMYGPETDGWKGKAVTVYSARVKAFGAWHDALRIKEQIPARNVGAAQMTDAMQEEPPLDDENDLLDVDEGEGPRVDPETGEILEARDDVEGDVLFGKDDHAQVYNEFADLGRELYGTQWGAVNQRNTKRISGGATTDAAELTTEQLQRLIAGMLALKDRRQNKAEAQTA